MCAGASTTSDQRACRGAGQRRRRRAGAPRAQGSPAASRAGDSGGRGRGSRRARESACAWSESRANVERRRARGRGGTGGGQQREGGACKASRGTGRREASKGQAAWPVAVLGITASTASGPFVLETPELGAETGHSPQWLHQLCTVADNTTMPSSQPVQPSPSDGAVAGTTRPGPVVLRQTWWPHRGHTAVATRERIERRAGCRSAFSSIRPAVPPTTTTRTSAPSISHGLGRAWPHARAWPRIVSHRLALPLDGPDVVLAPPSSPEPNATPRRPSRRTAAASSRHSAVGLPV